MLFPSNYTPTLVSIGLDGLATVAAIAATPLVGIAIAGTSAAYTIYGAETGNSPSLTPSATNNGVTYEYFGVTGGGPEGTGSNSYFGDVFGAGVPVHLGICSAQFGSPITYTITASSTLGQYWPTQDQYSNSGPATQVSMTVSAVPAVEISGTAYLGPGNQYPDANNYVYLQQGTCGQNYKIPTNSAGDFRFFGAPNTDYTVHATYETPANGVGSYHPELSQNSITVNTGSPGGLVYAGLHVGGVIQGYVRDASGQPIDNASVSIQNSAGNVEEVHTNSEGFYLAAVGNNTTYKVTASGDGASSSNSVTASYLQSSYDNFTLGVYGIVFSESGLPSGSNWSVVLDGVQSYSTGSTITVLKADGQYSYTISAITYDSLQYNPSPSSGSVTVSGSGVSESISFSPVSISFDESGLHGNTWSVTINGDTKSTSGSGITFPEPIDTTYSYSIGVPAGYSVSSSSGSVYLGSSSLSLSISFTPNYYNTVTFDESGLPSGTQWAVAMNSTQSSSTGTSTSLSVANGQYSYSIFSASVTLSNGE